MRQAHHEEHGVHLRRQGGGVVGGQHGRGVHDDVVVFRIHVAQELVGAAREEILGRLRQRAPARQDEEVGHRGFLHRAGPFQGAVEHLGEAGLVGHAEVGGDAAAAQVAVHQQGADAGVGEHQGEVGGDGALALVGHRGGDQQGAWPLALHGHVEQRGADVAEGLGQHRARVVGAQEVAAGGRGIGRDLPEDRLGEVGLELAQRIDAVVHAVEHHQDDQAGEQAGADGDGEGLEGAGGHEQARAGLLQHGHDVGVHAGGGHELAVALGELAVLGDVAVLALPEPGELGVDDVQLDGALLGLLALEARDLQAQRFAAGVDVLDDVLAQRGEGALLLVDFLVEVDDLRVPGLEEALQLLLLRAELGEGELRGDVVRALAQDLGHAGVGAGFGVAAGGAGRRGAALLQLGKALQLLLRRKELDGLVFGAHAAQLFLLADEVLGEVLLVVFRHHDLDALLEIHERLVVGGDFPVEPRDFVGERGGRPLRGDGLGFLALGEVGIHHRLEKALGVDRIRRGDRGHEDERGGRLVDVDGGRRRAHLREERLDALGGAAAHVVGAEDLDLGADELGGLLARAGAAGSRHVDAAGDEELGDGLEERRPGGKQVGLHGHGGAHAQQEHPPALQEDALVAVEAVAEVERRGRVFAAGRDGHDGGPGRHGKREEGEREGPRARIEPGRLEGRS